MASKAEKAVEAKKANFKDRFMEFILEVEAERKKVVWPTRETLVNATATITALIAFLTVYMAAAEVIVQQFFKLLGGV